MAQEVTLGATTVVLYQNKILLTKREDFEVWCLPGGHTDPGESVAETAVREVLEETGIEVVLDGFVGVYSRLGGDKSIHLNVFSARQTGGVLNPQPGEVIDISYFGAEELPADMFWWHRQPIADALAGVTGAAYTMRVDAAAEVNSRTELYALRDSMNLGRTEFYHWYFENRPGNMTRRDI